MYSEILKHPEIWDSYLAVISSLFTMYHTRKYPVSYQNIPCIIPETILICGNYQTVFKMLCELLSPILVCFIWLCRSNFLCLCQMAPFWVAHSGQSLLFFRMHWWKNRDIIIIWSSRKGKWSWWSDPDHLSILGNDDQQTLIDDLIRQTSELPPVTWHSARGLPSQQSKSLPPSAPT